MPRHLIPLDGSPAAEEAIAYAVAAGEAFGATTVLLRVLETDAAQHEAVDSVAWSLARAEAAAYLGAWRTRLERAGVRTEIEVREGRAAEQIVECAHERGVGLVVLCAHGRGGDREFGAGSTAQKLVAWGGASILVVRPEIPVAGAAPAAPPFRRLLVPVDGSQRGEWALSAAASLARARGASLLVAHAVVVPEWAGRMPPTPEDARLAERVVARSRARGRACLDEIRARLASVGLDAETRLVESSSVGRSISEIAREEGADLVVIAAHGAGCRGGPPPRPYGSVAGALLSAEGPSVLVLQDLPRREVTTTAAEAALAECARPPPR